MHHGKPDPFPEFGSRPSLTSLSDDFPRYPVKPHIKVLSSVILLVDVLCTYLAVDSPVMNALAFVTCGSLLCLLITVLVDRHGHNDVVHLTNIWIGIRLMISGVVWICIMTAILEAELKVADPRQQLIFALIPVSVVLHYLQFKSIEKLNHKS